MKLKSLLLLLSLMMISGMAFVSCSDDDDDGGGSSSLNRKLVGTWEIDLEYTPNAHMDFDAMESPTMCSYIQFQKDGTSIRVIQTDFDEPAADSELIFGTYLIDTTTRDTLAITEENVVRQPKYGILGNRLFLTFFDTYGNNIEFVYTHVDDSKMDKYFTKHSMKEFEVDLDKYKVSESELKEYRADLSEYLVNIDDKKVDLKPNTPEFSCPDDKHPHAIDMGEAGIWACCNVGADNPVDFGGHYSWGETEEKEYYNTYTYKFYDPYKYRDEEAHYHNLGDDISGTSYDVAHVKWGGKWKMPSKERFEALINNCPAQWKEFKVYNDEEIIDCYEINGNIYRLDSLDDVDNYHVIGGKLYKMGKSTQGALDNYYYIYGNVYHNFPNDMKLYVYKGNVYRFQSDQQKKLFVIKERIYQNSNFNNCYSKDDDFYFVNVGKVIGIRKVTSNSIDASRLFWLNQTSLINYSLGLKNCILNDAVSGSLFISRQTRNSLFLPGSGQKIGVMLQWVGTGDYFSSNPEPEKINQIYCLGIDKYGTKITPYSGPTSGHPVRAVQ